MCVFVPESLLLLFPKHLVGFHSLPKPRFILCTNIRLIDPSCGAYDPIQSDILWHLKHVSYTHTYSKISLHISYLLCVWDPNDVYFIYTILANQKKIYYDIKSYSKFLVPVLWWQSECCCDCCVASKISNKSKHT